MAKKRYGKLVRDAIPEIIRANGEIPNTRVMDTHEYRRELLYKLIEEAEELRREGYEPVDADFIKELADVGEVLDAIVAEFDISRDELVRVQEERREKRGGFGERIFLESVQER